MSGPGNGSILKPVRTLFGPGGAAGATDAELLERFAGRGPGAEAAFSALLDRHGPMVLAVCRRLVGDRSSADDAFQATWLALVRRAGSIRVRGSLAPWLFAVARRIALRARKRADRHRPGVDAPEPIDPTSPADLAERAELLRVVFEEIGRLPDRYRAPVVLCHLGHRTHDQAALELGWPVGTVRGRLSRARQLLRERLERRGVGLAIAAILDGLRREASTAVPPSLEAVAVRFASATLTLATPAASGTVPASVAALSQGATGMALSTFAKVSVVGTFGVGILAAGVGVAALSPGAARDEGPPPGAAIERPQERPDEPPDPSAVRLPEPPSPFDHNVPEDAGGLAGPVTISGPGVTLAGILRDIEEQTGVTIAIGLDALSPRGDQPGLGALLLEAPLPTPFDRRGEPFTVGYGTAEQLLSGTLREHGLTYQEEGDRLVIVRAGPDGEAAGRPAEDRADPASPGTAGTGGPPAEDRPSPRPPFEGGSAVVSGNLALAEEPAAPASGTTRNLLDPTIEQVERLFAEKGQEAIEIASLIDAWTRLGAFERRDGEPTEVDRFVESTRKKLEERLVAFAGRPEEAPAGLERLRDDLKRLLGLHNALVGDEAVSASLLANRSVERVLSARGESPTTQDQQRWERNAERVRALFSELGVELGHPIVMQGQIGFGMMGGGFNPFQ